MLPTHKTKIVATIGPASQAPDTLAQLIRAGMSVARLNFSHGTFDDHRDVIGRIRRAEAEVGRSVTVMADLPGPKIRIGQLAREPIELQRGQPFVLTTRDVVGDEALASVSFQPLPQSVAVGGRVFLNDGLIQLAVERVDGTDVQCRVTHGGELRSRKGLNLPGAALPIEAFTARDRECLAFALREGVDAVSQSFVQTADDVMKVRQAAAELGHHPFIIAKIERAVAVERIDEILEAADGLMVARGDLGVEMPIEEIPLVQKRVVRAANLRGRPVITATQLLESMTTNPRPTRAEATDVANAILDGTDAVMLSGESATGDYPVEAVAMLARIASTVEPHRPVGTVVPARRAKAVGLPEAESGEGTHLSEVIALSVDAAVERIAPAFVMVPTRGGTTARSIARYRLPVWVVAVCPDGPTCAGLRFSYGVVPIHAAVPDEREWRNLARRFASDQALPGRHVVLAAGPSPVHPDANYRMEILSVGADTSPRDPRGSRRDSDR